MAEWTGGISTDEHRDDDDESADDNGNVLDNYGDCQSMTITVMINFEIKS